MLGSAFLRFVGGHFTVKAAIAFIVAVMGIIATCLVISWQLYETCSGGGEFNLVDYQISFLGDPLTNPCGHHLFTATLWTLGCAAVPLLSFYRRALAALEARVAGVFTFFFALGIPAMFVVGIVPWSLDPDVHIISAGIAFGGAGVAYLLAGIGIIIARVRDRAGKIPASLVMPFLVYVPFVILGIWVQVGNYLEYGRVYNVGESWRSFLLWEWLLFFAVLSMCASTTIALARPARSRAKPTRER
ncbi:MAG: hypothetical protein Q6373_015360 [Candidatus Sigynarchaeota archaeon]